MIQLIQRESAAHKRDWQAVSATFGFLINLSGSFKSPCVLRDRSNLFDLCPRWSSCWQSTTTSTRAEWRRAPYGGRTFPNLVTEDCRQQLLLPLFILKSIFRSHTLELAGKSEISQLDLYPRASVTMVKVIISPRIQTHGRQDILVYPPN